MFATNLYRAEAMAARNERLEGDILAQASDLKRDYDELERKKLELEDEKHIVPEKTHTSIAIIRPHDFLNSSYCIVFIVSYVSINCVIAACRDIRVRKENSP